MTQSAQKVERYNGWANYQTWNVVLWLRNDESMYRSSCADARCAVEHHGKVNAEDAKVIARNAFMSDVTGDNVSLSDKAIDWTEVADAIQEDI